MGTALSNAGLEVIGGIDPDAAVVEAVERESRPAPRALLEIYRRWERQQWSAEELDLAPDRRDWEALDPPTRESLLWFLSLFFHGEHRVTTDLAPFVPAAPTHEAQLFLATQLADEARHAYFFDRYYTEVLGLGDEFDERARSASEQLSPAFRAVFDDALGEAAEEVSANPDDAPTFARGIALYHLIIESTLALPGQRSLIRFCQEREILPGFRAGFMAVARDESRHVGGGVQLLRQMRERDPSCREAVEEMIADLLPKVAHAFRPPGANFGMADQLGFSMGDQFRFGVNSLRKRLEAAGYALPRLPLTRLPAPEAPPVLSESHPTPAQLALRELGDELTPGTVVNALPAVFDSSTAPKGDLRLRFRITGPGGGAWRVVVADGVARVLESDDGDYDWSVETDSETWLGIAVGELSETEAFMLGRLEVAGDLHKGLNLNRYFAASS